jgi:hypothetical protein
VTEPTWKNAIFMYESSLVSDDLKLVDQIAQNFRAEKEAAHTMVQVCRSLEQSAIAIDDFKGKTCGSAFSLAVINLNMFGTKDEFNFLMQPNVLGDPRMIFLCSLKSMTGDLYTYAKNKVIREAEAALCAPSCIEGYAPNHRVDAAAMMGRLAAAYLRETEERLDAKRRGTVLFNSDAMKILLASNSTFYGKKTTQITGIFRPLDAHARR